jgi:CHAD domain-containing protein
VHEFRKSVRRARSLVRLIADSEPKLNTTRVQIQLREAFLATGSFRDAHVLEGIAKSVKHLTDAETYAYVMPLLAGTPASDEEVFKGLHAQIPVLDLVQEQFAKSFPPDFSNKDLRRGYQTSYERAQKRLNKLRKTQTDDAFHDLRKRIKELRYQVEMIHASVQSVELIEIHSSLVACAKSLGSVTDLMILRDHLRAYVPEAKDWETALENRIAHETHVCIDQVSHALVHKPKPFARLIVSSLKSL